MVVGEFIGKELLLEKIPLDKKWHETLSYDITNTMSFEELVNGINTMSLNENNYIRLVIVGDKKFEINVPKLKKLVSRENILQIIDNSTIKEDLVEISHEFSLKGIFVKNRLEEIKNLQEQKDALKHRIKKETDPGVIDEKENRINELEKRQGQHYKAIEIFLEVINNM